MTDLPGSPATTTCAKPNRPMAASRSQSFNASGQCPPRGPMMLTIGVLIAVTAVFGILRLRVPPRSQTANLGSMSEKWLAEQRAGHSS